MDLLSDVVEQTCPWCGETVEVRTEEVGPQAERYIEDCPVCCRPWAVDVMRVGDEVLVQLHREGE
jgi:hypothetical protein